MSDDLTIGVGIDARGFISGIRSTEEQAKKASQALTRAYQASARSVNGLTDAVIATRAQTLLNLGVTMEQVDAFKQTAVSVRKYKEELKKVSGEYENNSAGLNKYLVDFGKQNELLSLATISMRELRAEEAALAAMRKARPAAPEPAKAATPTAAKMDAVPPVAVKVGDIDVNGLNEFNARLDTALVKAKHLAAAMLGIGSMKQLSGIADEWTTVNNRLKLVIDSTTELMQVRSQLMASANKTGQSLSTVAELYNKLVTSQNQTGISGSKLLKLTDTINKAMVIGGGSAESQAAALVQLSQAFASGTLRGEELNSVLEQAPGLAQTIAKGLGTTVGQLRALAAAGKLTSEAIANAILKQAPVVDAQFSKMVKTIGQSATTLKNKVMSFVGALDETTGTSRKAGEMMEWLGNHLGTVAKVVGTVAAVYTGKYAASIAAVIIRKYAEIAASEKSTAAMLKEAAAAKFLATAKASSAASGAGATGAAGVASAIGSVAGMAKGGWVGLVAGLATAAFTYYEISKATDVATNSLRAQIGTIEELKEKYAAADTTEKTHLRNEAEKNYKDIIKQRNKAIGGMVAKSVDTYATVFRQPEVSQMRLTMAGKAIAQIEEKLKNCEITADQAKDELFKLLNIEPGSKSAKALEERLYKADQLRKQSNEYAKEINAYGGNVPLFETAADKEQAAAAGVKKVDEAFKALIDSQTQSNALLEKQKELMAGGMSAKVAAEVAKASTGQLKGKDAELKEYTQSLLANESLQKQIDNINSVSDTLQALGKSADEAKAELVGGKEGLTLFQLSTKNATSAQMEQAKQAMAQSKLYREQLQNQQTLKDMVQQAQEAKAELLGGKNGLIAFRLGLTHATDEQIRQAQAVNALTEQIQKQKSVMATLEGLKEQVETLGMDAIQRQLYGMRKNGATPEQLRYAEAMLNQIKAFDEAQKDTKAAAQDLSEAAEELKNGSRADKDNKPISIFSKEYRDREDAYWKKKREEERSMGGISFISGRRPSAPDVNLMSAPMAPAGFGSGKGAAKDIDDMIKVMEAIKVEISNGDKNVTLKALFDAPNGANEFKQMLKNTLHSVARDLR